MSIVAVVTGATRGLGRGIAREFGADGATVVVTGRNAGEALIEIADLVTEMTMVKHPFRSGIKAQAGVEF